MLAWAGLLEGGLHAVDLRVEGSLYIHDAVRRFHLRPRARAWYTEEGETFVTINSRGFRDRERMPGAHPGAFRIAVIGDSTVAGLQVGEAQMFTRVAERALAPARVEVLNFGVPNYGLAQQFLTLRDEVLAYQPDLVVEAISLTNAILNSTRTTSVSRSPYPYFVERNGELTLDDPAEPEWLSDRAQGALLDAENRCDLALLFFKAQRVLTGMADVWLERVHLQQPLPPHFYERSLIPTGDPAVEQAWDVSEKTLRMMRDLCAKNGVPFWLVTLDIAGQVDPDPNAREAYLRGLGSPDPYYADSRLMLFAEQSGIPALQSAPVLAAYASRTGQCLHGFFNTPRNYGHLNATGHEVLGNLVAEKVSPLVTAASAP